MNHLPVLGAELSSDYSVSGCDSEALAENFATANCNAHSDEHHNWVECSQITLDWEVTLSVYIHESSQEVFSWDPHIL